MGQPEEKINILVLIGLLIYYLTTSQEPKKPEAIPASKPINWLARHQNAEGSWSVKEYTKNCGNCKRNGKCESVTGSNEYDIGVTALACLAFLGEGYYPGGNSGEDKDGLNYDDACKKALKFLMAKQDSSGRIGNESDHYMYNHALATLALVEGSELTSNQKLKDVAQKAVDHLLKAQVKDKDKNRLGWGYELNSKESNSTITAFCAMVAKSAEHAKLTVPDYVGEGIIKWYDSITDEKIGLVGYDKKLTKDDQLGYFIKDLNGPEKFDIQPTNTAAAIMSKLFFKKEKSEIIKKGAEVILKDYLPQWDEKNKRADFLYWYFASYALFQLFPSDSDEWKKWNEAIEKVMLKSGKLNEEKGSCLEGSFEPVDRWGCKGGRVYSTALGALILQVYYRYAQIKEKRGD